jgi:hypothetical protein
VSKEYKMIASIEDIKKAKESVEECFKRDLLPVFQASETDITRDNEFEMILYCGKLQKVEEYKFSPTEENNLCIIRISGCSEKFVTSDLL